MMNVRSLVLATLVAAGMGCNGNDNPLVGDWTTASTTLGVTITTTYEVNGDNTLVVTKSGSGDGCSGSETTTGLTWAATSASITFSGTPSCTGSVTCGSISVSCSGSQSFTAGSCTYALSNNNDTLALSGCSGMSDVTVTRSN